MKGMGTEITLHAAQLGSLEWAYLPGTLRDGQELWNWGISLYGSSVKGTWREGFFAGDP